MDRRHAGALVTLGSAVLIASATLTPGGGVQRLPASCALCDSFVATDFVANIGLFLPLGIGLALLRWSAKRTIGLALIASTAIELIQFAALPGRDATIHDVVSNTIGAALGWVIVRWTASLVRPSAASAKVLTAIAVGLWFSLQLFGSWIEQPSLPVSQYWGQWAPELGGMRTFQGRLISAHLSGGDLPRLRAPDSDRLRANLRAAGTNLSVVVVPDRPGRIIAPLAAMYDEQSRQIFFLGERARDAVYRVRRRSLDLHLRTPGIVLPDAISANDSLSLDCVFARGRLGVARKDGRGSSAAELRLGPWLLWSHFVPLELDLQPTAMLVAAVWSFLLVLPIGYWWRLAEPRIAVLVAAGSVLLAGGMIVSTVFGQPSAPAIIWLASAAGFAAGAGLARALITPPRETEPTRPTAWEPGV